MIEYFRFFLSIVVMLRHIWQSGPQSAGWQSVFAFYTLSGYLMTRVLNQRYGFSALGFLAFALNRVLRLWPAYLIVACLGALLLVLAGTPLLQGQFRLPDSTAGWLVNVSVLGIVGVDFRHIATSPMLVPNAWSLSIELFCYILLGVYFAKSPARLLGLAAIGAVALCASTVACARADNPTPFGPYCFLNRYVVLQAGFIPFAAGGLLFFWFDRIASAVRGRLLPLGLLFAACEGLLIAVPALHYTAGPFVGCAVATVMIVASRGGAVTLPGAFFIGRASYHFFIAHWTVAAALFWTGMFQWPGAGLFFGTFAGSLLLSAGLCRVEVTIERMRRQVSAFAQRSHDVFAAEPLATS